MEKTYTLNMQLLSLKQKNTMMTDYFQKHAIKMDELDIMDKVVSPASQKDKQEGDMSIFLNTM